MSPWMKEFLAVFCFAVDATVALVGSESAVAPYNQAVWVASPHGVVAIAVFHSLGLSGGNAQFYPTSACFLLHFL